MQGLQCGQWREVVVDGVKTLTCEEWVHPGWGTSGFKWLFENAGTVIWFMLFAIACLAVVYFIGNAIEYRKKQNRIRERRAKGWDL